jgi:hypothetical protein
MTLWRCYHHVKAWLRNLLSMQALSVVLSSFGTLWLLVEIATFFVADTKAPNAIRHAWPLFALVGLLIAVLRCRPHLTVSHKLNGRDVTIEIAVGDVFSFPGALIIGSNATFDTLISRELISERSVQGIFTKKYYGDATQLDAELSSNLRDVAGENLQGRRIGKAKKYPIGTCVRVNPKQRTGYLLAIAEINEHGVASGNFNDLKESLAKLWEFVGRRGSKEPLIMPVLGTGFSRLPQTREEVVREMIKSFVAACSEMTFADKLTIVIAPYDMEKYSISLDELGSFLRHVCSYTVFSTGKQPAVGTPV